MAYTILSTTESHQKAVTGVVQLTLESAVSANIINMFRNVFPSIASFVKSVSDEFTSHDETELNFSKASRDFVKAEEAVRHLNFVKFSDTLLQTPEGFIGRYPEYLDYLAGPGMDFIQKATDILGAYYQELAIIVSSGDAKKSLKDQTRLYSDMEKSLEASKKTLGTFFNANTSNALRTAGSLFDRSIDIIATMEDAAKLNKLRLTIKSKEITSLTKQISSLIDLLVESSETGKIPELSGPVGKNIAQGALVAAHYVEFIGVLRYRIEEAIAAVGIMSTQVAALAKSK